MLQIDLWKRVLIWLVCVTGLLLALPNAFYTRVEMANGNSAKARECGSWDPKASQPKTQKTKQNTKTPELRSCA